MDLQAAIDELVDAYEAAKAPPPNVPLRELVEIKEAQIARLDRAVYAMTEFRRP